MKQYGDITKLDGAKLEPVDLIVGGSPCQDLSIAGQRKGLYGERSGLFMEMIRIIKEMRNATNFIRCRYLLWENVCGAFSSGQPKGGDFQAVLAEIIKIVEPEAPVVPIPAKGWSKSGVLMGDGWSLAWRTHDAQYWGKTIRDSRTGDVLAMGTPQRRRRIALVADFGGDTAPEILFELSRLSGNPHEKSEEGEGIAGSAADSTGEAVWCGIDAYNHAMTGNVAVTLNANSGASAGNDVTIDGSEVTPTLISRMTTATGNTQDGLCVIQGAISFQERCGKPGGGKGILIQDEHTGALSTMNNQMVLDNKKAYGHESNVFDPSVHHGYKEYDGVSETVRARYGTGGNNQPIVVSTFSNGISGGGSESCVATYALSSYESNAMKSSNPNSGCYETETARTLDLNGGNPACNQGGIAIAMDVGFFDSHEECSSTLLQRMYKDPPIVKGENRIVRRLTPKECERLQGFPDDWTNIHGASDSKRYKALGNSICLPAWEFWAHRFVEIGGVKTIGSLFDGIGGFPLCFKRAGAETLWTSEIEPFCEDVVRYHYERGEL